MLNLITCACEHWAAKPYAIKSLSILQKKAKIETIENRWIQQEQRVEEQHSSIRITITNPTYETSINLRNNQFKGIYESLFLVWNWKGEKKESTEVE